jgi:hypothetical protein
MADRERRDPVWRATGDVGERAARTARRLWPITAIAPLVLALPTYHVRHQMLTAFGDIRGA